MNELESRIRGIIGYPLTPFRADFSLDAAALERNVEEIARHPFCAINAPAGISEIFSLSPDEAAEVLRVTVRVAAGRMPVIGSVCFNTAMATEAARKMEAAGADALLVLPPYYQSPPEDGLLAYYRAIGNACGLPLAIYSRGWAAFSPEQVEALAGAVRTLRLWKDGQGDARTYQRIMSRVGDRLVWIGGAGDDCGAIYAAIGVRAFTSSVSALAPRLSLAWGEAALDGDFSRLNELLERFVHPLFAIRARKRGYEVAVMKKAAEILGRPSGPPRPPIPAVAERDVEDIRKLLASWSDFL
ncbi:MAG: dihydrodipicolinate synthase family protein [Bryobacteraceae bacterium]|nr:dihydrodipicolinate synthase family protein [Bryobacteraceae bacterium]